MKILVTGGAGFIGSHVSDALISRGHEVTVLDDLSSGHRHNVPDAARFVEADIRDAGAVEEAFAEGAFDIVCHQAAQTSVSVSTREPARDAEINLLGSIHLLEACRRHRVKRFIFASTGGAIYGEVPGQELAREDQALHPISPYACSKLAVENYLDAYRASAGLSATILRYANVYGPRQDPHGEAGVVAIFCERLVRGESLKINARRSEGDDGCVRDYVFVDDVVRANVLAAEGELDSATFNVGTGVGTTTRALSEAIATALGVHAELGFSPHREGDLERSVLRPNATLARAYEATSLAEGIARTAEWFEERANVGR